MLVIPDEIVGSCCNSHEWGTSKPHVYHILFFATLHREFALSAPKNMRKRYGAGINIPAFLHF